MPCTNLTAIAVVRQICPMITVVHVALENKTVTTTEYNADFWHTMRTIMSAVTSYSLDMLDSLALFL